MEASLEKPRKRKYALYYYGEEYYQVFILPHRLQDLFFDGDQWLLIGSTLCKDKVACLFEFQGNVTDLFDEKFANECIQGNIDYLNTFKTKKIDEKFSLENYYAIQKGQNASNST